MLIGIGNHIAKEIKSGINVDMNRHFLRSCENAIDTMHEVNTYINRYQRDAEYKESVRKLTDRIRNMRDTSSVISNYGKLMFDAPMKFKLEIDNKYNTRAYLMCFQARILIFDIETNEQQNSSLKDNYFFMSSIKVTSGMNLRVEEDTNKKEATITVMKYENFIPNNRESFSIKVPLGPELDELKKKFESLIEKASFRPHEKHKLHDFETVAPIRDIDIRNPKPPPYCAECNRYLYGQILTGYRCYQCDSYYHEYCFREAQDNPYYCKSFLNSYSCSESFSKFYPDEGIL